MIIYVKSKIMEKPVVQLRTSSCAMVMRVLCAV